MKKDILRLLIDATDRFASLTDAQAIWDEAQALAADFGAVSVNIGAGSHRTGELLWMRSNMRDDWLRDYVAQGFMALDPFVASALHSPDPLLVTGGSLSRADAGTRAAFELNHQLAEAGYALCYGTPFAGTAQGTGGMVVFGFDAAGARDFTPEKAGEMRLLAAVIAAHVGPPGDIDTPGVVNLLDRRLTPREREVLALLADGHGNDGIADRLGLAEATVQKHLRTARERLDVHSREQALVKALRMGLIET